MTHIIHLVAFQSHKRLLAPPYRDYASWKLMKLNALRRCCCPSRSDRLENKCVDFSDKEHCDRTGRPVVLNEKTQSQAVYTQALWPRFGWSAPSDRAECLRSARQGWAPENRGEGKEAFGQWRNDGDVRGTMAARKGKLRATKKREVNIF